MIIWFSKVIQNKKVLVMIGIFVTVGVIGAYLAKDPIFNILSSQHKFLAAIFSEKSSASATLLANNNAVTSAKPVKDCLFEISQKATHAVIFNEIAWMGNKQSANSEWMELKNISPEAIDMVNWQLVNE